MAAPQDDAPAIPSEGADNNQPTTQEPSTQPTPMVDAPGKVRPAPREPNTTCYRDRGLEEPA